MKICDGNEVVFQEPEQKVKAFPYGKRCKESTSRGGIREGKGRAFVHQAEENKKGIKIPQHR